MTSFKLNFFSNVLMRNSDVRVLFPEQIDREEKLRVLWLCHGGSGDENEWLYHSTIAELPDRLHIAIVLVDAEDSCYVDMAHGGAFTTFLGEELPGVLRGMFPHLSDRREDNFISGLSNGGYGCFIIGLTYPDKYSAIGAFSAGDKADAKFQKATGEEITPRIRMFGQEEIHGTKYSIRHLAEQVAAGRGPKPRIYHACGSLDPWLEMNLQVRETFETLQDPEFDYCYDQMEGLGHEWAFWDEEIRRFLKRIL